jgi:hypothetical protein
VGQGARSVGQGAKNYLLLVLHLAPCSLQHKKTNRFLEYCYLKERNERII